MRLAPLYRIRFTYPESWAVGLDGGWQQMFFIAEGRCEGSVTGRFRGAKARCTTALLAISTRYPVNFAPGDRSLTAA